MSKIKNNLNCDSEINSKQKDFYLIQSSFEDRYIVYSPLREIYFWVNNKAADIIENYLLNETEIPQEYPKLYKHFQKMESMIIKEPQERTIDIENDAVILLSQKCNLACTYCYAQHDRSQDTLSESKIKILVDYILTNNPEKTKYFSFLGGGEPTVTWDLFVWAVNYIKTASVHNKKTIISLTTNATLLNEERIAWLKENKIKVGISFDILPRIQNSQRPFPSKKGSFDVADKNIKMLISNGFSLGFRSTITNESIEAMPEIVTFTHNNYPEVKNLVLEPVSDIEQNQEDFYEKYTEYFFKARKLGHTYKIDVENSLTKSLKSLKSRFCRGEFCITPNGEIVSCHRVSSETDKIFKSFHYGTISDKIQIYDEKMSFMLQQANRKRQECSSCFAQWHCAGICAFIRLSFSEEQLSYFCNFAKKIILKTIENKLFQSNNN